jgi:hypothetical protein
MRDDFILCVEAAECLGDFVLRLYFNDGSIKRVDLSGELEGNIFRPLQGKEYFEKFFISDNTVEWANGADFDPEFLYRIGVPEMAEPKAC